MRRGGVPWCTIGGYGYGTREGEVGRIGFNLVLREYPAASFCAFDAFFCQTPFIDLVYVRTLAIYRYPNELPSPPLRSPDTSRRTSSGRGRNHHLFPIDWSLSAPAAPRATA